MHDHTSHKLLTQIPLTVSPFANLPTSITLPYDYISPLPASLPPPSSTLIISPSGQSSTTPESLQQLCRSLISHIQTETETAKSDIDAWVKSIEDRELQEKRRVAPGYLDTGVMMLEPVRVSGGSTGGGSGFGSTDVYSTISGGGGRMMGTMGDGRGDEKVRREDMVERGKGEGAGSPGEELDRAFGGLGM